jgi:hypothetical protein
VLTEIIGVDPFPWGDAPVESRSSGHPGADREQLIAA